MQCISASYLQRRITMFSFTLTILIRVSTDKCEAVSPSGPSMSTDHVHGAVSYHCWKKRQKFSSQHIVEHLNSRGNRPRVSTLLCSKEDKMVRIWEHRDHEQWFDTKSQSPRSAAKERFGLWVGPRTLPSTHLICNQFHQDHLLLCWFILLSRDVSHCVCPNAPLSLRGPGRWLHWASWCHWLLTCWNPDPVYLGWISGNQAESLGNLGQRIYLHYPNGASE